MSDAPSPSESFCGLESMQKAVFECLSLGVVLFDAGLSIAYRNRAAGVLLPPRGTLDESLRAATLESQYQDWTGTLRAVIGERREQRRGPLVFRRPASDGAPAEQGASDERLVDLLLFPLSDSGGTVTGGILVMEDVTARAGLEKRLAVSERMAAVGNLAARVAHELNNPLDGILRYLNLAIRAVDAGRPERLGDYLVQARGGLVRMAEIIRELVEFSRSSYTAFDESGINAAVEEAIKVIADKADAAGVSIVCRLERNMPAVRSASLFQVFCNLIKNAIDAMPEGGTLTIVSQIVGTEAVIRFEDTGIGLPDDMGRLFEPFFTTKPPGQGTGLGLAICKDMIEKYNGRIIPARRPEGGSVFTVRIPLESCARLRRPGAPPEPAASSTPSSGDKS